MEFWKMNGAGNDFIIINNFDGEVKQDGISDFVKTVCERHLSVGADGLMLVERPSEEYREKADYKMSFYNSDGSKGEMCGNGARCICRFGYENDLCGEVQRIETTAGLVIGERIDNRNYKVRLNDLTKVRLNEEIEVDGKTYIASYVELGDPGIPHAVLEIEGLSDFDRAELFELGRKLRYHGAYEKGANINFFELIGPDHIYEITYERGVEDFTYACGTGTGSVVTVLTLQGRVSGHHVRADMRGGTLIIDVVTDATSDAALDEPDVELVKDIYLTGPTNIVIKGDLCDEEIFK